MVEQTGNSRRLELVLGLHDFLYLTKRQLLVPIQPSDQVPVHVPFFSCPRDDCCGLLYQREIDTG
jgi:hypothetical protein